jgi:hypothetical protein
MHLDCLGTCFLENGEKRKLKILSRGTPHLYREGEWTVLKVSKSLRPLWCGCVDSAALWGVSKLVAWCPGPRQKKTKIKTVKAAFSLVKHFLLALKMAPFKSVRRRRSNSGVGRCPMRRKTGVGPRCTLLATTLCMALVFGSMDYSRSILRLLHGRLLGKRLVK